MWDRCACVMMICFRSVMRFPPRDSAIMTPASASKQRVDQGQRSAVVDQVRVDVAPFF